MKSEIEYETSKGIAVRNGVIVKDCRLLFSRSVGGDLDVEAGDTVILTVISSGVMDKLHKNAKDKMRDRRVS